MSSVTVELRGYHTPPGPALSLILVAEEVQQTCCALHLDVYAPSSADTVGSDIISNMLPSARKLQPPLVAVALQTLRAGSQVLSDAARH
jgi:hypothetical protein